MRIAQTVRELLWKAGYDISHYNPTLHPLTRKIRLLKSCGIDLVLDVGANRGQFALQMRRVFGYAGRIVSFEPLSSAYKALSVNAQGDANWKVMKCALGDKDGEMKINISANSCSSSLLDIMPSHLDLAPSAKYTGTEVTEVRTLDSLMPTISSGNENIYLKMDAQGYESKIMAGARVSLDRIGTIQLEMSLIPLYRGEAPFGEMYALLTEKGYSLVDISATLADERTGQLLQVDGVFRRL